MAQPLQISFESDTIWGCVNESLVVFPTVDGGLAPYQYTWSGGGSADSLLMIPDTTGEWIELEIVDGNQDTAIASVWVQALPECVWPGDADGNGFADNLDVLALGHTMGISGPVRPDAHLAWVGQPASAWSHTLQSGVNYVHSDVDGNGLVEILDLAGIEMNYLYPQNQAGTSPISAGGVPLFVDWPEGDFYPGDTLRAPIILGEAGTPMNQFYGLAFSLLYDPGLFEAGSIEISYDSSWLGSWGQDLISVEQEFSTSGQLDIGITLINQVPITGFGRIADITVVIDDLIGKKNGIQLVGMDVSQVSLLPYSGPAMSINIQASRFAIVLSDSNHDLFQKEWKVFPSPATEFVQVEWPMEWQVQSVRLLDRLGKTIISQNPDRMNQSLLAVKHWSPGLYFLQIETPTQTLVKKLMIQP